MLILKSKGQATIALRHKHWVQMLKQSKVFRKGHLYGERQLALYGWFLAPNILAETQIIIHV